ncbi:alpha/beta fold hydrolase [Insolitispirillum peregrinum]|uniref:hypothetical protein n=1 Tax=Insolitispirillum peregrinum TaxID=80876 RepID=UPI00361289E8
MSRSDLPQLLIVGDIHGFPQSGDALLADTPIKAHILTLAELSDRPDLRGEALHGHLVHHGGLQRAAQTLGKRDGRPYVGLGFSAGGTALWRAVSAGLALRALICVSSTRLRLETAPLTIPTMTLWGDCDPNRPTEAWNGSVPTHSKTYAGAAHDFYRTALAEPASPLARDIHAFLDGCCRRG